jgi:glycosyltransferase involved in cell wall biosynthesis
MTATPRVTMGVMAFNNEQYLATALDGVLAQDFTDFEIVICDNRSTDSTWDICRAYADKDERIRIFQNEKNLGFSGNFNRVVSLARGEYFRLTAHDDLIEPTLLSKCVPVLDAHPDTVLVYPYSSVIDGDGNDLGDWDDVGELLDMRGRRRIVKLVKTWRLCNELFGVIRTDVLRQTKLYAPFSSTDMRLLVELAARGKFRVVPETLFRRRVHAASSFRSDKPAGTGEHMRWLEPELAAKVKKMSARRDRTGGDYFILSRSTLRALLTSELPVGERVADAATFGSVFHYRQARIFLGKWRRKITRTPIAPAPWDAPAP